jgi:predicted deacylase
MQRWHFVSILIAIGIAASIFWLHRFTQPEPEPSVPQASTEDAMETKVPQKDQRVIGTSVEGRNIEVFTYGTGGTRLLFVGGVHGGYEWNSVLLAYAFIDYLDQHPEFVPANVTISVIPSLNPDGLFSVVQKEGRFTYTDIPVTTNTTGKGRFNARAVDLNRNFDCKWQAESTWRGNPVSAGTAPFSEPEALALRDFIRAHQPQAAVFWHSVAGAVYASECTEGILPETLTLMHAYAEAAAYAAVPVFDAYPITGDAEGWLASLGIPAITVELETRDSIEWERNLAGITALLKALRE